MVNGVLERADNGMPLWAPSDFLFQEGPFVYLMNGRRDAVVLWDYRDVIQESVVTIPDTTESGLPVRWIASQALNNLMPYDYQAAIEKQEDKLKSEQDRLDR